MAVRNTLPSAVMRGSAGVKIDGRSPLLAGEDSDEELEKDWCFVSLYGTVENEENFEEEREEPEDVRQVNETALSIEYVCVKCIWSEFFFNVLG